MDAAIAPPAPASPSTAYPIAPGMADAPIAVFVAFTAPVRVLPSPVLVSAVAGALRAGDGPN